MSLERDNKIEFTTPTGKEAQYDASTGIYTVLESGYYLITGGTVELEAGDVIKPCGKKFNIIKE